MASRPSGVQVVHFDSACDGVESTSLEDFLKVGVKRQCPVFFCTELLDFVYTRCCIVLATAEIFCALLREDLVKHDMHVDVCCGMEIRFACDQTFPLTAMLLCSADDSAMVVRMPTSVGRLAPSCLCILFSLVRHIRGPHLSTQITPNHLYYSLNETIR